MNWQPDLLAPIAAALRAIDSGELRIKNLDPQEHQGSIRFATTDGRWTFTVFNDCGGFDYFDRVQGPNIDAQYDDIYPNGQAQIDHFPDDCSPKCIPHFVWNYQPVDLAAWQWPVY